MNATQTTTGSDELRLVGVGTDGRLPLSQAEPPALAPVAPTPEHVPLIPGENMLSAATIRALWRAQIARNQTNDRYKPQNTCAKLTASERREIKRLYAGGVFSQRVLARMFEVSQTTIHETITRSVA